MEPGWIWRNFREAEKVTSSTNAQGDARTFKFTERTVKTAPAPAAGRITYRDTEERYWRLVVTASGARTFYVAKKVNGRSEKIWLGRYPDLPVEAARKAAQKMVGSIAGGGNPADRARAARSPLTVRHLFDEYMTRHARPHKKRPDADEALFRLYCGPVANHRIAAVHLRDVQKLHAQIGRDSGQYTANRVLCLLHIMFARALDWGFSENANPAHGVRKFREQARHRFLEPHELPVFFEALRAEDDPAFRDFFALALFTGARRGNLLSMRWPDVNLDRALWIIPAEVTKTGTPYFVPLIGPAIEILASRRLQTDGSEFVFPGRRGGHLVEVKGAWARVCRRAGIAGIRIHDLRRTCATYQANAGASLYIVGQSLGHRNYATTQKYAPIQEATVRASMERGAEALRRAAGLLPETPSGALDNLPAPLGGDRDGR